MGRGAAESRRDGRIRDSAGPTANAARAIARAAYVFLYPLVVNYGAAYEMAIDPSSAHAGFGGWRRWRSSVQEPGSSGLTVRQVSCTRLDLGPEPVIVTPPPAGAGRCITSWLDLWGLRPEHSGSENHPGPVLITLEPRGAHARVAELEIRSETRLVNLCCTWELHSSTDRLDDLGVVQEPSVVPLSAYVGDEAPQPPHTPWFRWHDAVPTGPTFWDCAAFALSLTTPHADDLGILELLHRIGIVAGDRPRPQASSESVRSAIEIGMGEAIEELARGASQARRNEPDRTRRQMDRDYFGRAVTAFARPHDGQSSRDGHSSELDRR